jgi:hypothetical protein
MSTGRVLVLTAKGKPCVSDIHTYCNTFDAFTHSFFDNLENVRLC